jgi:hypothetical protein
MKKRPSIRLFAGLLAACGITVGSLIATTGSASAATYSCSGSGSARHCYAYEDLGGPVFYPDGQLEGIVVETTELEITCWYYGTLITVGPGNKALPATLTLRSSRTVIDNLLL